MEACAAKYDWGLFIVHICPELTFSLLINVHCFLNHSQYYITFILFSPFREVHSYFVTFLVHYTSIRRMNVWIAIPEKKQQQQHHFTMNVHLKRIFWLLMSLHFHQVQFVFLKELKQISFNLFGLNAIAKCLCQCYGNWTYLHVILRLRFSRKFTFEASPKILFFSKNFSRLMRIVVNGALSVECCFSSTW